MNTLNCDFCGGETTKEHVTVLPVDRYEIPAINYWNFSWGWGACEPCASHLRGKDWLGLLDRAVVAHPKGEKIRFALAYVYLGLATHQNGPLREWDPAIDESEADT